MIEAAQSAYGETVKLNALNTECFGVALEQAKEIDGRIKNGATVGRLAGAPLVLGDNIMTKGLRTTCSSKSLENFVPPYDATVSERLKASDALIVGKANIDEFGFGCTGETSYFGETKNFFDNSLTAYGGGACAVATGQAFGAVVTDTGGEARFSGVCAGMITLKPTYGAVSRFGVAGVAPSLDCVSVTARTVADCRVIAEAIYGYDPKDTKSLKNPPCLKSLSRKDLSGLTVGYFENYGITLNTNIKSAHDCLLADIKKRGAKLKKLDADFFNYSTECFFALSAAELSSTTARIDGVRYGCRPTDVSDINDLYFSARTEGFSFGLKKLIMLGAFALVNENYEKVYLKALKMQTVLKREITKLTAECDIVLTPLNLECLPLSQAENSKNADRKSLYLQKHFTAPVSLAGLPAVSFPVRRSDQKEIIGMQVFSKANNEALLLDVVEVICGTTR
jgi:aspartyl-tRNA(Asn)/glutamyl-tRNA(Gln) amidotransferase subunit A